LLKPIEEPCIGPIERDNNAAIGDLDILSIEADVREQIAATIWRSVDER
jgi:hypothetical protein